MDDVPTWTVAEIFPPERELILAWDSWWCPTCSARTFVADARCCGGRMVAVRIEMYERYGG